MPISIKTGGNVFLMRDVLRYRHSAGLSLEAIARALKISKAVVAKYLRLARTAGLS